MYYTYLICSYPLRYARPPILGGQHHPEESFNGMLYALSPSGGMCNGFCKGKNFYRKTWLSFL